MVSYWTEEKNMKIRVHRLAVLWLIVILILMLEFQGFGMFSFPGYIGANNSGFNKIGIICMIAVGIVVGTFMRKKVFQRYTYLYLYLVLVLLAGGVLVIGTSIDYPQQSLQVTFYSCQRFLVYFFSLLLLMIWKDEQDFIKLLRVINLLLCIWYVVILLQAIIYNGGGEIYMTRLPYSDTVYLRNGNLRTDLTALGNLFVAINFYFIFNCKVKDPLLFLALLLGIVDVIYVQQTRMYFIALGACAVFTVILQTKYKRYFARNVGLFVITVLIIMRYDLLNKALQSFALSSMDGRNTAIRLEAFAYFINAFYKSPLYGLGAVGSDFVTWRYHFNDMGYVGLLAETGLLSIVFYTIPMIRYIYIIVKIDRSHENIRVIEFLMIIYTYLLVTSASLIATDIQRVILMSFTLAIFEFWYANCKDKVHCEM
jgi:hypothetical protein